MTVEKGIQYVDIRTDYQSLNTYNLYVYAKFKPVKQPIFTTLVENNCDNLSKVNPFIEESDKQLELIYGNSWCKIWSSIKVVDYP